MDGTLALILFFAMAVARGPRRHLRGLQFRRSNNKSLFQTATYLVSPRYHCCHAKGSNRKMATGLWPHGGAAGKDKRIALTRTGRTAPVEGGASKAAPSTPQKTGA